MLDKINHPAMKKSLKRQIVFDSLLFLFSDLSYLIFLCKFASIFL